MDDLEGEDNGNAPQPVAEVIANSAALVAGGGVRKALFDAELQKAMSTCENFQLVKDAVWIAIRAGVTAALEVLCGAVANNITNVVISDGPKLLNNNIADAMENAQDDTERAAIFATQGAAKDAMDATFFEEWGRGHEEADRQEHREAEDRLARYTEGAEQLQNELMPEFVQAVPGALHQRTPERSKDELMPERRMRTPVLLEDEPPPGLIQLTPKLLEDEQQQELIQRTPTLFGDEPMPEMRMRSPGLLESEPRPKLVELSPKLLGNEPEPDVIYARFPEYPVFRRNLLLSTPKRRSPTPPPATRRSIYPRAKQRSTTEEIFQRSPRAVRWSSSPPTFKQRSPRFSLQINLTQKPSPNLRSTPSSPAVGRSLSHDLITWSSPTPPPATRRSISPRAIQRSATEEIFQLRPQALRWSSSPLRFKERPPRRNSPTRGSMGPISPLTSPRISDLRRRFERQHNDGILTTQNEQRIEKAQSANEGSLPVPTDARDAILEEAQGSGGIEQAAVVIRAVIDAMPDRFKTQPNLATAAASMAAALRAAMIVIHRTSVAKELAIDNIAATRKAVQTLPVFRRIAPSRITAALKIVLDEIVKKGNDGSPTFKENMAFIGRKLLTLTEPFAMKGLEDFAKRAALVASYGVSRALDNKSRFLNALFIGDDPVIVEAAVGIAEEAAAMAAVDALSEVVATRADSFIDDNNPGAVNKFLQNLVEAVENVAQDAADKARQAADAAVRAFAEAAVRDPVDNNDVVAVDHLAQLIEGVEQVQVNFIPELLQRTPESTPERLEDVLMPDPILKKPEDIQDEPLPELVLQTPEQLEDEPLPQLIQPIPEHLEAEPLPELLNELPEPSPIRRSPSPTPASRRSLSSSSSRKSSPRSSLMETTAPKERSFKKKTFVENMRDDAILLIEWFKDKFEGTPQQKRDLRDLQLAFIKLAINGGHRRYLLHLSLRVKEMAEEKLQHGDQTDYRPIISMLISGYFHPELYRTYIQGEAPKELVAVKIKWMNHLERLVIATMLQDPKEKTGEVAKEKWKVQLSIINKMKIAAEEALHEELRWGQEWLIYVESLVDAAVFEKQVPTVSERRTWYNPRRLVPAHFESPRRDSFEYEVMILVEESFTNGPGGIAQAAAAIRAVVEAVPGHFETETSPAAAASPVAAALRAAVRVIHYTGVARGLHRGDIDAALEAVKKLPTIRKIEPSRIAAALKSVLQAVVRREDDGSHSIKTDMALRQVGAALDALNQEDAIRLAVTVAGHAALVASAAVSASISSTSGSLNASSIGHNPELVEAAMGNAEEAAANVAVGVLSVACANGATNIINEDNPDPKTLAKNIVEAVINATPEAARETFHAAEVAVETAAYINNVVAAMASFNLVHDEDLNKLPKEERKCLVQTAKKYIQLGEKNRREPTFFEHLGQAMEKFEKLYLEKLFKQMVVILRSKNSFDSGVATALVAVHRYISRIQLKMNLQKTNAASDIPTDKLRTAVMDALHNIKTLHNRPVEKRKTMLRNLVENIYKTHKARGVEHLIMAMAWDDKDKRGLSKLYDMIAFMHDFVLSAR